MPPCTHPPHASIAAIRSSARSACSRRPSSGSDPDKSSWAHAYRARAGRAASPWCRADQVRALFLEPDTRELLLEPREPPAAIHQLLLTAGPGRMRLRVDVEVHGVAFLAPGAPGGEFGAVGHHHLDGVIVRVQVGFHGPSSCARCARVVEKKSRLYSPGRQGKQVAARAAILRAGGRLLPDARRGIVAPASPSFGRGCKGQLEMNVAERDAARAVAVEHAQSAAAGAAAPVQSRKLRPLISLMFYITRYRWRALAALLALLTAAVTTLVVPVAVRRM